MKSFLTFDNILSTSHILVGPMPAKNPQPTLLHWWGFKLPKWDLWSNVSQSFCSGANRTILSPHSAAEQQQLEDAAYISSWICLRSKIGAFCTFLKIIISACTPAGLFLRNSGSSKFALQIINQKWTAAWLCSERHFKYFRAWGKCGICPKNAFNQVKGGLIVKRRLPAPADLIFTFHFNSLPSKRKV